MALESIMLREVIQTEKEESHMLVLIVNLSLCENTV